MQDVINMVDVVNIVRQALADQLFPAHSVIEGTGDIPHALPGFRRRHISILILVFIKCVHTYSLCGNDGT